MLSDLDDVDRMGEFLFLLTNSYEAVSLKFQIVPEQMCCLKSSLWSCLCYFMILINLSNLRLFKAHAVQERTLAWFRWLVACLGSLVGPGFDLQQLQMGCTDDRVALRQLFVPE